jgi:AcrR family transcriptional regulator
MVMAPRRLPPDPAQADPAQGSAGERARAQLLEAAGEIFAERGYGQATSKEICERAGMNAASVNYHFGGFEHLYSATLSHAQRHLVAIERLHEIAASDTTPRQKLRAYIAQVVQRLARPATCWEMRLLSRELVSPTPAHEAFYKTDILPKIAVLRSIIASLLGVAPSEPVVGRALLTVIAPGLILAITHREMLVHIVPGLANATDEIEPLTDHFERFIHAGLKAIAAEIRASRPRRPSPPRGRLTRGGRAARPSAKP